MKQKQIYRENIEIFGRKNNKINAEYDFQKHRFPFPLNMSQFSAMFEARSISEVM